MSRKQLCSLVPLALVIVLLSACGPKTEGGGSSSMDASEPAVSVIAPQPDPEPEPELLPYTNPLTGEGCATDIGRDRPVAVMINNLKKALPQLGVSQADIIYECPAEGGITRMLAVFQSVEGVGNIGSVRSAREYYVSLAAGLDAIFLHAGGSDGAYIAIKRWGVTALDCVNGPYEGSLFWRDADRKKNAGLEHSVLTSGETIEKLFPTYSRLRRQHEEGYTAPFRFTEDGTPDSGAPASKLTVRYSDYKTGEFEYDSDSGLYQISQYGKPYIDGNNNQKVGVRNVLVLYTDVSNIPGDTAGRLDVRLKGTGSGLFLCGGQCLEIVWSKDDNTAPMTFQTADGKALELGVGKTYINIVGENYKVTVE